MKRRRHFNFICTMSGHTQIQHFPNYYFEIYLNITNYKCISDCDFTMVDIF